MTEQTLGRELPVGSIGRHANGWWGVMTLIVTEGALFGFLLFSYYYIAVQHGREWLPEKLPDFRLSGPNTLILIASSVVVWRGETWLKEDGRTGAAALCYAGAAVLGIVFIGIQYREWMNKEFSLQTSSYGSLYFTITAFHMLHVAAGIAVLAIVALWTAMGYFDNRRNAAVSISALYWHFVDVVWLALFFTFYITPRLGVG